MITRISLLVLAILAGLLVACNRGGGPLEIVNGSGNVVNEERSVSDFTAVSLEGVGHLVVDQTGTESLTITTDDNFLPYIETRVSGNKLIIRVKENVTFMDLSELVYHVTVADLTGLELDGLGQITATGVNGDSLSVNLNGAGEINVSGEVTSQTVEISGAGSYQAADLKSQEATVDHNGIGMVVVQVEDQLDVHLDGLGSVEYIGDPEVNEDTNGLGTVHQR